MVAVPLAGSASPQNEDAHDEVIALIAQHTGIVLTRADLDAALVEERSFALPAGAPLVVGVDWATGALDLGAMDTANENGCVGTGHFGGYGVSPIGVGDFMSGCVAETHPGGVAGTQMLCLVGGPGFDLCYAVALGIVPFSFGYLYCTFSGGGFAVGTAGWPGPGTIAGTGACSSMVFGDVSAALAHLTYSGTTTNTQTAFTNNYA